MVPILDGNSEIGALVKLKSIIWSVEGICLDRQQSQIEIIIRAQSVQGNHPI